MAFQAPIPVKEALERIHRREYLLPAIQREFVWGTDQITRLFDSLMRGYPIGSFLFWEVRPEHKRDFQFYEFLRDYHERDATHNEKAKLVGDAGITAVLDGQQRLTSLYIGLYGTYAERKKYTWAKFDANYPWKRLYLNLTRAAEDFELEYDFQFRTDEDDYVRDGDDFWFRVGHVLSFTEPMDIMSFLIEHKLATEQYPMRCLNLLHKAIAERPLINFYKETDQDLDKVLNIFIRVNSGGTPLSYSDLLLSIATAQWEERDAREAIHGLVDEINTEYGEFSFTKDFVLKCCLVLADLDMRWKVDNFNSANMRRIEELWDGIADAVRGAVKLLASFGFSASTLTSNSAVIPIVYYLYRRGNPAGYVEADAHRHDRGAVRRWLNIALLKRTFGGVPDNVLRPLRDVIREHHAEFPFTQMVDTLRATTRSMRFEPEELEGLLDVRYGKAYSFSVLALLYPDLDYRNHFHQDHIHPRSAFTPAQLSRRGIPEEDREFFTANVDRLPNLQLLEGLPNMEKSNRAFAEWLADRYPTEKERQLYRERHYIPDVDLSFASFPEFFRQRRALMLEQLRRIVGMEAPAPVGVPEHV